MTKNISFISGMLALSLITACGKDGGGGSSPGEKQVQEQTSEGSYRAILRPLNNHTQGYLPSGAAEFKFVGDSLEVKTYLDDDQRVSHMQSVHVGTRCPTNADSDYNGDGVVDVQEAYRTSGEVFIPLDAELNSFAEGAGLYPVGKAFTYVEKASLSSMMLELTSNPNLGGRVVMIHGTAPVNPLPATAATVGTMPSNLSLPIACGVIQRVK